MDELHETSWFSVGGDNNGYRKFRKESHRENDR